MAQPQLDNSGPKSIHCINPDCPCPYPQAWEDASCSRCGTPLRLKNRYSARQRLGVKGLATLYTVWDRKDKTERLLKVLRDESLPAQERFEQEAAILARLRHPGILRAPDGFTVALSHPRHRLLSCLVLEKIRGQTLKSLIDHHIHGYPEVWALDWLRQAVEILGELHKQQIVHCDISPSNLLLCQDKQLRIVDLSAAQAIGSVGSNAHRSSHTSAYSSLEQANGGVVGPTADFYALGRTFIHLFTGKCPQTLEASGKSRWHDSCPLVSQALAALLDEMTHPDVQRRPTTAAQIQERLTKLTLPHRSNQVFLQKTTPTVKLSSKQVSSQTATATTTSSKRVPAKKTQTAKPNLLHAASAPIEPQVIYWAKEVCRDSGRAMLCSAIGASVGVTIAFGLNQWTPIGHQLVSLLSQLTHLLSLAVPLPIPNLGRPEILMFGLAGLGTAVGLTKSESFDQSRHAGVAQWMGFWGYIFGWLSLPVASADVLQGWQLLSAIAVAVLTLGLSLPSHFLVHALVAAVGTAQVFGHIFTANFGFAKCLALSTSTVSTSANCSLLWHSIPFFGFLALNLGFWLSVSSYLVVPSLRFFGWR